MTTISRLLSLVALLLQFCVGHAEDAAVEAVADPSAVGRYGEDVRVAAGKHDFSEAERMLWLSDHLSSSATGARISYHFTRHSELGDGFEDTIQLDVLKAYADGSKDVHVRFFGTATRQQSAFFPENLEQVRGNPIFGLYLQGDVHEMERLTKGAWRHFHRRIKLALAEGATVEPVEVEYEGRKVAARRITIRPYADDPHKARYLKLADKSYEFVLSDAVPGVLYSISTRVPGPDDNKAWLIEEQLIFSGVSPVTPS